MCIRDRFVLALIVVSLLIGILGYMGFEHLSWIDAFLNSAMLLGGMGPVNACLLYTSRCV